MKPQRTKTKTKTKKSRKLSDTPLYCQCFMLKYTDLYTNWQQIKVNYYTFTNIRSDSTQYSNIYICIDSKEENVRDFSYEISKSDL